MGRLRPGFNFTAGRVTAVVPESYEINDVELQCAYGIAVQDRMHPPRRAHSAASMILSWPCHGSDDVLRVKEVHLDPDQATLFTAAQVPIPPKVTALHPAE